MLKKISLSGEIFVTKGYFVTKFFSVVIVHQDLSFGGFALKIEFVVFLYKYRIIFVIAWLCNNFIDNKVPGGPLVILYIKLLIKLFLITKPFTTKLHNA